MAQQALKHIVKKVVSASSAVIASSGAAPDDCKDDMDEIAHLVFGAALPSQGTPATPTPAGSPAIYEGNNFATHPLVPGSCTTPPAGQPIQVHADPSLNAAIISLGRRMASNSAIQRGVMETISQSGWLMYGSGGMFIPLEETDSSPDPGVGAGLPPHQHDNGAPAHAHTHVPGEISDDDQPGIPLSDDEDWEEDFGDGSSVIREEEALARSYPHMSILGTAPRPLPNSNSVPLLSSMASSHDHTQPSPDFTPTITPTPTPKPSRASSIASASASAIDTFIPTHHEAKHDVPPHAPTTTSNPNPTPSLADRRRARAAAKRKAAGIIPSFVSWIRSFFVDVPAPTSTSPPPSTSGVSEEKHGVVEHDTSSRRVMHDESEGMPQATPVEAAASASASAPTSASTSPPKPESWWSKHSNFVAAAVGVATVILVLLATKRVNANIFYRVVAYLTR